MGIGAASSNSMWEYVSDDFYLEMDKCRRGFLDQGRLRKLFQEQVAASLWTEMKSHEASAMTLGDMFGLEILT